MNMENPIQQRTQWFHDSGYGVMVHWTAESRPNDGGTPIPYADAIERFDVRRFASQIEQAGAGYVIFTISHAQTYLAFPSPLMDSILPGRACRRDLYDDLHVALSAVGAKLIFYWPSIGNDHEDCEWASASRFATDERYFAALQYRLVEDIGRRYGQKLAGWWVDDCYDADKPGYGAGMGTRYDFRRYAEALRAGNPHRIVTFNYRGTGDWVSRTGAGIADYAAGEKGRLTEYPNGRFSGEGGTQWHCLVNMDGWWVYNSQPPAEYRNGSPRPRFSDADVIAYMRKVIAGGGVFTYNAAPFQDSLISDTTMRQLAEVRKANLRPRS